MIKRFRVTVDGNSYDVTVEVSEESTPAPTAPAVAAPPLPPPPSIPAPAASAPLAAAPVAAIPKPAAAAAPGEVRCPLAGRVTAVVVAPGQAVKEGDHLVTLEAMKMNTFVFAPRSGKVTAIQIEVGALVEENQVLATIG